MPCGLADWNPWVMPRQFFVEQLAPLFVPDHSDSEAVNSARWRERFPNAIVAASAGVFTHDRLDR
jgi:hypothetical protein